MIAYNLMSIFRLFVLQEKTQGFYLHYDIEPLLLELILKKVGELKLCALTKNAKKMVRWQFEGLPIKTYLKNFN